MADSTPEGALDAINEALGDAVAPAAAASDDADDSVALGGAADGEGGEGAETPAGEGEDGAAEHAAAKPEGESEGEKEGAAAKPDGRERNPDGTFKKPEDKKPEGDKPGEQKQPDALNDPIPKDLKPATQERIRTLISTAKEATEKATKVQEDFDYLVKGVQSTGASPEQYGEVLSWLALFNSNDPVQQTKALELVETVADRLATLLGKERTVSDPLSAHPDLRDAVQKGQITGQYAREIARTRAQQNFRTELTTAATAEQQAAREAEQALATARSDLNALEATLKATDPQYEAKKAQLVPILQPIFQTIPPPQWKAAFQKAYSQLKLPAPARVAPKPNGAQPMRARGSAAAGGSAKPAAGSMLDAVSDALASMGK